MQERRLLERWPVGQKAGIQLKGAQSVADCFLKDINFRGMQISLPFKLARDAALELHLFLSQEYNFAAETWVVWQRNIQDQHLYGLCFSGLRATDKEKIYQFLRGLTPKQENRCWFTRREKGGEEMISEKESFADHRVFERFSADIPARCLEADNNQEVSCHTRDISAKGIGLVTNNALAVDSALEMWLDVPDRGDPFYTRGKVSWMRPVGNNEYRVGVNLEKADLMGLARILRWVRRNHKNS